MALFEFGLAKERKTCLERIQTALKLASAEYQTIYHTQRVLLKAVGRSAHLDDDAVIVDAYAKAQAYLEIANENVMSGLGKRAFFNIRPYYPPLDPNDPHIESFFKSFKRYHLVPSAAPSVSAPAPSTLHEADGVFVLDEERELRGIMAAAPEGEALDDFEGFVFIATAGPFDADEREWLAHAIWGTGINVPDDYIPDDEALIHHARLTVKRLFERMISGYAPAASV